MAVNMQREDIKTYIFYDSETTGLPYQEHNKTKITEICFAAVQAEHLNLGVFPRILPKISLCFNPKKYIQPGASAVSGLFNDLLEAQPEFNSDTASLLYGFIELQRKPICFVAHNGNIFDYPILRAELFKAGKELPNDLLCVDSLKAFKELYKEDEENQAKKVRLADNIPIEFQDGYDELLCDIQDDLKNTPISKHVDKLLTIEEIRKKNETTPPRKQLIGHDAHGNSSRKRLSFGNQVSFKLGDLYKLLTQKDPVDAHQAEHDVAMLIECTAKLGQRFTDYANANSLKFCDIPMMTPGRHIGT